eukprot:4847795-Pyramimonas_sp.AAC.1
MRVHVPTSCSAAYRTQLYTGLNDLRHRCQQLRPGSELIGGDWNGRVGRDTIGNDVQIRSELMRQKLTEGGKAIVRWIVSTSNFINT